MTRPARSSLVLDGGEVKHRLEAERIASRSVVHVDWLRFTVLRRNSAAPTVDRLFPVASDSIWDEGVRVAQFARLLRDLPDFDAAASTQALELAEDAAAALGEGFSVAAEVRKGHDFYRYRWSIELNGCECGWVGYLSSGDSPRQAAQANTIHCNIFGAACTFAAAGWRDRFADLIERRDGVLTRCDLALDFFDGLDGGLDGIVDQYRAGVLDVGGKRLKSNTVGDWLNGHARSLYFGSKEAGKQTNCYEKGDQLFGVDAGSLWLRIELRYGNKLRVLDADMLRRPADFFAGASDWHALMLAKADALVTPQAVSCVGRLPLETVEAECARVLRWLDTTAGSAVAMGLQFVSESWLLAMAEGRKLPGRLRGRSVGQLKRGFAAAEGRLLSGVLLAAGGFGPATA